PALFATITAAIVTSGESGRRGKSLRRRAAQVKIQPTIQIRPTERLICGPRMGRSVSTVSQTPRAGGDARWAPRLFVPRAIGEESRRRAEGVGESGDAR